MSNIHVPFLTGPIASYATAGNRLHWREDLGYGYLPSNGFDYGESYWEQYKSWGGTEIELKLNSYRELFVLSHFKPGPGEMCDVGIGNGRFVMTMGCKGYDINPHANEWLVSEGRFGDPYLEKFEVLTFWDVLEHIDDPTEILSRPNHIFTSIPLHKDVNSLLRSKHLKPNEHIWHFTHQGIINFMQQFNFGLVDFGDGETAAGRESIRSYYFTRI